MKQIYLLILFLLLFSCKENEKERIQRLVNEWQGKEIVFPKNITFIRFLTDTVDYQITQSKYKVLTYVDSIGCTSCKLQLPKWKKLIEYVDSATNSQVPFLFFFQPKDDKELRYILKVDKFDRPVCVDHRNELNLLNKFPADIMFQTFLLDKDNKVIALGNPIHNSAVKDLYLRQLTEKENPDKRIKTTAEAISNEIDFGNFPKGTVNTNTFEIINTGNNPLVITDIDTTCGCTTAMYDKKSAKPGDILRVKVTVTPKDTGFFDETITVRCNTNRPVKVKIKGNVQ